MSASSSRRGVWIALGAISIVAGLVGAVLLWNGASQRRTNTIEGFARAPIGCDTTLDFIEPGEYLLFIETAGTLDGVRGTCDVEGAFDNSDGETPDVDIMLLDPDGNEIDLGGTSGDVAYDAGGFTGASIRSVDIQDTDDHVIRVEADVDDVFVVAIGRNPNEGVAALQIGAVAAGVVGLLVGLAFVLLGSRKSSATVAAGQWNPAAPRQPGAFVPGGVPQGPPVYGQPSGPPQYGGPPVSPQPQYGQQPSFGGGQPQYGQAGPPVYGQPQFPQQVEPRQANPEQASAPQQPWVTPGQPEYRPPSTGVPRRPDIPGQPTFPQAPVDPAGSAQPIEWAPRDSAPRQYPSETAPPDAEFLARLRQDRSTEERPPPPPPD